MRHIAYMRPLSPITSIICLLVFIMGADAAAPTPHPLGSLKVGDVAIFEREMKAEYSEMYATITGDRNPLHFDQDYADSTRFEGLVCHGGLASGMLNALVAQELPGPGSVFMKQELEYTAPTRPGDTLIATGTVTWVHESKAVCHMDVSVKVKATELEVLKGKVVVYRMLPKKKSATSAGTG
jgi:acyl dehydratase